LRGGQGQGKTALLDTFLAKVHHPGLAVLRARCVQMTGIGEPFLPLLEALERRCREPNGGWLIERLNQFAPSWLYQLLNVLAPDEMATLQLKVSHSNAGRMLREGADFFETMGKHSIFVLTLDNAHWSDEFTLDLLNFLAFRCSAAKLLTVISYRPCEDGPGAAHGELKPCRQNYCIAACAMKWPCRSAEVDGWIVCFREPLHSPSTYAMRLDAISYGFAQHYANSAP
jgi:hypothetical protein